MSRGQSMPTTKECKPNYEDPKGAAHRFLAEIYKEDFEVCQHLIVGMADDDYSNHIAALKDVARFATNLINDLEYLKNE